MKGLFVTFEGPDGSGKSTQIQLLHNVLEQKNIPHIVTREPGGTSIGNAVRHILLDPSYDEMSRETEVLLYAASRAQHVSETILPALRAGKVVLCDRFVDASIAYQGAGAEEMLPDLRKINHFATQGLTPDRTYMLMLSAEEGKRRLHQRSGESLDRIELKDLTYHQQVFQMFASITQADQERVVRIDASQNIDIVQQRVEEDFLRLLTSLSREWVE
ncbi:dTMP kinase [Bacillaceae bacterium SIJ1]|uniref:dTMP kinase n=1 Tax=Litoribacterium kuwaitense TaxID=1398745 RepID=UPI0013E9AE09|nr:dTMP kinase [Litoribacterium kuwaitense]NGP45780.1 dTMP kinase [Litoribacterium kuwaitense]